MFRFLQNHLQALLRIQILYLPMFKMRCGIPNAYILDITMYKMHVSFCSYCTIRVPISKTLTGTYERGYTYVFEMCCYRTLDIVIYIVANYKICTQALKR